MDVCPRISDQRDLHREQRQVADEGDRVKVDDQRVVETVLAQVIEGVGAEARQHSHPDQGREDKKRVPIRAQSRRKRRESYCCYFRIPRPNLKIDLYRTSTVGSIGRRIGSPWKDSRFWGLLGLFRARLETHD